MSTSQPTVVAGTQWAERVFSKTFCHNLGKNCDTSMVEGLLEAYYKYKHEKMKKSQIWGTVGGWDQISEFFNFCTKSFQIAQTQKRTLPEGKKPCVSNPK